MRARPSGGPITKWEQVAKQEPSHVQSLDIRARRLYVGDWERRESRVECRRS